jgi:hypothetical protein
LPLYVFNNQVKEDKIGRACSTNAEKLNAYRISVGKLEGKRPLGRHRRKWEDNIKINLREIGWGLIGLIDVAKYKDQ